MVRVRDATVRFGAFTALDGVSLDLAPGEIHGLAGENGAGKSTLARSLAGLQPLSEGTIESPGPIVLVHQEQNLIGPLSAEENIALGAEPRRGPLLDRAKVRSRARTALAEVAAEFDPATPVERLSVADRQLVEIARALAAGADRLILDEPTAVLSEREVVALHALVRRLREEGKTVVLVSHLLPEMLALCDRITVLRDGRLVGTFPAAELTPAELANRMVGRELKDVFPARSPRPGGAPILTVTGDVPFDVRAGEIVGLAGLVGAGRTETLEAVAGLRAPGGLRATLDQKPFRPRTYADALAAGVAYVSEDRKDAGLHLAESVAWNATLARLSVLPTKRDVTARAREWVERLSVRPPEPDREVGTLSGGNQQKVALARQLETGPRVLLLDEPTRGVDVGAKQEIYRRIAALAAEGIAVAMASSELPELLGLCHRIVVLRGGRAVAELDGPSATEAEIVRAASGVTLR